LRFVFVEVKRGVELGLAQDQVLHARFVVEGLVGLRLIIGERLLQTGATLRGSDRFTATVSILNRYGWHGFRRGIASNLYALGADDKIVQRILRHAKSHVTKERYIKAFDPAVLASMKKLEATLDAMSQSAPIVHQIN
jgi:integrase